MMIDLVLLLSIILCLHVQEDKLEVGMELLLYLILMRLNGLLTEYLQIDIWVFGHLPATLANTTNVIQ